MICIIVIDGTRLKMEECRLKRTVVFRKRTQYKYTGKLENIHELGWRKGDRNFNTSSFSGAAKKEFKSIAEDKRY